MEGEMRNMSVFLTGKLHGGGRKARDPARRHRSSTLRTSLRAPVGRGAHETLHNQRQQMMRSNFKGFAIVKRTIREI
jgi:hypothetical protein